MSKHTNKHKINTCCNINSLQNTLLHYCYIKLYVKDETILSVKSIAIFLFASSKRVLSLIDNDKYSDKRYRLIFVPKFVHRMFNLREKARTDCANYHMLL